MDGMWSKVYEALLQRGFRQAEEDGVGYASFDGELEVRGDKVPVRLTFKSEMFLELPMLRLLTRPEWLPRLCAHVSPAPVLELCYPGRTTDIFDRFIVNRQVLGILDAATAQLAELRTNGGSDDVLNEFGYYWQGGTLLLDVVAEGAQTDLWVGRRPEDRGSGLLVTTAAHKQAYHDLGMVSASSWYPGAAYFATLDSVPKVAPEQPWPPTSLGMLKNWFEGAKHDQALKELRAALGWMYDQKTRVGLIIFQTPRVWFGVEVNLTHMSLEPKVIRKRSAFISYALGTMGNNAKLQRLLANRIDADFIVTRNLPDGTKSLGGLKILQVGVGTIGGYLADSLVRVGAGTNGGLLHLVDKQTFEAGNVGRHRLSLAAIGLSKAHAMTEELRKTLPFVNVYSTAGSVFDLPSLKEYDLIIDATGDDPVSQELNVRYLAGDIKQVVYAWVVGNGLAAQSFTCHNKSDACLRCLTSTPDQTAFIPDLPHKVQVNMGRGCDAPYIPFSVQPSLAAVTLTIGAVLDLVSGKPGHTLRTTMLDPNAREITWKHVKKQKPCPACSH